MRLITALLTALLIAPLSAYFAYENHARLKAIFEPEKQDIISMISLENACSVPDTAFQVSDLSTGRTVPFSNGKARLMTKQDNPIQLQLNSKYKAVWIDLPSQKATPTMVLKFDCSDSQRMQDTFKSLNKSLGD